MKKILSIILTAAMLCSAGTVFAEDNNDLKVKVNGEVMQLDVAPIMENDRILLPMRAIFEALGCNVAYREDNDGKFVTATHGEDQIVLEIGKKEITINGETKELDTAAKIVNDRTLVPVRAVSEALGADVTWDDAAQTASVTTKYGDYKINSVTDEKTVKDDDGTVLMYINYVYPVIENTDNNSYINSINSEYKAYAEKFVSEAQTNTDDAKDLLNEMGKDNYIPMEFNLSYDVHTNKGGIISVTDYEYYNLGGAHPNTARVSRTFDIKNEKELALSDILKGDDDERHTMIYDVFVKEFEEEYEDFTAETASELDKECDNVKFYLNDNSIVLYFDVYQVGSYAMGYPTVELQYSDGIFKIDLSDKSDKENTTENTTEKNFFEGGNYTDEMKMPVTYDYNDSGASSVERKGDHKNSPYFSSVDFYNAKPTETLSILPNFKTMQQTSWWSCGVCSAEMVLNYYGKLGDWNEKTLADLRTDHSQIHMGTCLDQIIEIFDKVGGFNLETTYDYEDNLDEINMAFIKQHIKDGVPVIVGWNDWGGHWQVIIGYDDMGTEYEGDDVIIVADPFDTTDHNQDGYGVYGAERFICNFTFYNFFNDKDHLENKCFIAVKPE